MLEIIILFVVGRHIASIAKRKNRNPVGYVLLLVGCYFGGAVSFGIAGMVVGNSANAAENEALVFFFMGYLVGAALGVGLAYLIVNSVAPIKKRRRRDDYDDQYDDYDDCDRPRRRRHDEIDDEDDHDRPRARRRDDEYDHDRPRRGRRDDYE
jgi:hypothetical protein